MAQTGYTPIQIYSSSTPTNAPSPSQLANSTLGSELAINIADGKLFYKDSSNLIQVLAWKVTPISAGGTGLTSYTAGDTLYYASGTTLSKLAIGSSGNYMSSSGTAPQWSAPAALTKTDDTNVTLTLGGSASTALLNAASLTLGWTGQLATGRGGTGLSTYTAGDILYYASGTALTKLGIGSAGQVLKSTGSAPAWENVTALAVTSISFGTTGLTPSTATQGAVTVAGTLVAANGGTGQSSYTIGDILYASGTTTLSKLADVATGNALISGGVGVAPSWGKIGLTTHVSGTLPIANGGTNSTDTPTAGGVGYGTGSAHAYTAAGTSGQVLQSAGSGAPTWSSAINGVTIGQTTAAAITGTVIVATSSISNNSGTIHYFSNSVNTAAGRIYCPGGGSLSLTAYGSEMIRCNEDSKINFFISSGTNQYEWTTSAYYPVTDNARTLGGASNRWSTVYAGNGTINTSDANTKQQIRDLSAAEKQVALAIKAKIKAFKFNDAVKAKGDGARIHVGVIAQEVEQAFQDAGLNADQYGLFCRDTWWERIEDEERIYFDGEFDPLTGQEIKKTRIVKERKTYDHPVENGVETTLYGVRYEELLAFIIAAM